MKRFGLCSDPRGRCSALVYKKRSFGNSDLCDRQTDPWVGHLGVGPVECFTSLSASRLAVGLLIFLVILLLYLKRMFSHYRRTIC